MEGMEMYPKGFPTGNQNGKTRHGTVCVYCITTVLLFRLWFPSGDDSDRFSHYHGDM